MAARSTVLFVWIPYLPPSRVIGGLALDNVFELYFSKDIFN